MNNSLSCTSQCSQFLPEINKALSALSVKEVLSLEEHLKISGLSKSCYLCVRLGISKMKLNENLKILGVSEKMFCTNINNAIDLSKPQSLLVAIENFENKTKKEK